MKRTISSAVGVFATAVALLMASTAQANQKACSNATLSGSYGVLITGSIGGLPFAAINRAAADGNGNLSGTGTVVFNGSITPVTISATYVVNSDCTGTAAFSNGTTQTFVMLSSGDEVFILETDNPVAVITGDAKRIDEDQVTECANSTLSGNYAALIKGSVTGLPIAILDRATADGAGNLSGSGTVAFNGSVFTHTISATYAVNSDCTGSATFSTGQTQALVLVNEGHEVLILETDNPAAFVTGDAKLIQQGD